jgi:hypothetical protein
MYMFMNLFGCTDRPDEPGSLRTRCAPLGAGQADTLERGELLLDWIKDYNYAAALPRHLRLLRLSLTTRTVTVRPADSDTACRPPVGLGPDSPMPHSPDTARQPPGRARARCPCFSRSRQRPASSRVPTVSELLSSVAVVAHPARIGRGCSRAGYPCHGLLGHPTLCPPVCRPRDRAAADPSLPARRCQQPTRLSDGCGSSRTGAPGVGGLTLAHASSAGLPAPGRECRLRSLCFTSLRPRASGIDRACSSSGQLGCSCKHGPSQPRIRLGPFSQDGVARLGCQSAELADYPCGRGPLLSSH